MQGIYTPSGHARSKWFPDWTVVVIGVVQKIGLAIGLDNFYYKLSRSIFHFVQDFSRRLRTNETRKMGAKQIMSRLPKSWGKFAPNEEITVC